MACLHMACYKFYELAYLLLLQPRLRIAATSFTKNTKHPVNSYIFFDNFGGFVRLM